MGILEGRRMDRGEEMRALGTALRSFERRHSYRPIVRRNRYSSWIHCRPNFGIVKCQCQKRY